MFRGHVLAVEERTVLAGKNTPANLNKALLHNDMVDREKSSIFTRYRREQNRMLSTSGRILTMQLGIRTGCWLLYFNALEPLPNSLPACNFAKKQADRQASLQ